MKTRSGRRQDQTIVVLGTIHVRMYPCMNVSMYKHIHICMYAHMTVSTYECIHVCMYPRMYVSMYVCT